MPVPACCSGPAQDGSNELTPGHGAPIVIGFAEDTTELPSPWVNADTPMGNSEETLSTTTPEAVARRLWSQLSCTDESLFELRLPEGSWLSTTEPVTA